jgi:hypothetical protein
LNEWTIQCRRVIDVARTRGREIALIREVRTFRVLHARDQLRDQKIDVRVSLTVRVRRHVDRRTGNRHREVAAVIEIEPAQEVLVRLTLAAVLCDDDAGHGLEHLALSHEWADVELLGGDRTLTRGRGDADEIFSGVFDVGEVRKCAFSDDDNFGTEREVHDLVVGQDLPRLDRQILVVDRGEVDQPYR